MKGIEEAKSYLNNIDSGDSVCVVHHNDLDGFSSGLMIYNFCLNKTKDVSHLAYNHGEIFNFESVEKYNKLIFSDLAKNSINDILVKCLNLGKKILFIDHHPVIDSFDKEVVACYVDNGKYFPASRIVDELIGEKCWLGVVGTMGDMGHKYDENKEYVESFMKKNNLELESFLKDYIYVMSDVISYFQKDSYKAFSVLSEIKSLKDIGLVKKYSDEVRNEFYRYVALYDKESEKLGLVNYFYLNPSYPIKGFLVNELSSKNEGEIYIFVSPKDDGRLSISARMQNDEYSMPDILAFALDGLEGAKSGGHHRAAGGIVLESDLEKFKSKLSEWKS